MSFRLQTRYFLYITLISLSSKYFANLTLMSILIFPCLYLLFADGRSEDVTEIQNWNDCEKLSLNCGRRVAPAPSGLHRWPRYSICKGNWKEVTLLTWQRWMCGQVLWTTCWVTLCDCLYRRRIMMEGSTCWVSVAPAPTPETAWWRHPSS